MTKRAVDERAVGGCQVCDRDLHPSLVTEYFTSEGAGTRNLCVCSDCIEEFEQDENLTIKADELDAATFDKLVKWAKIADVGTDKPGKIKKVAVTYEDGSVQTAEVCDDGTMECELIKGGGTHAAGNISMADFARGFVEELCKQVEKPIVNQTQRPAKDAPVEFSVCEALMQDGVAASYEYPGYVSIVTGKSSATGVTWAFGTADEYWAGHQVQLDEYVDGTGRTSPFASDSRDVSGIVEWIKEVIDHKKE